VLTVFARTSSSGGPRGFSLFLVEKNELDPASFTCLPRIKTHGIRGADVSGIRFERAFVSEQALIGSEGAGLELTLKSFQITRSLFPALSLGALDTALRTTVKFTLSRKLYGGDVFAIPLARKQMVQAFVDLLIADCLALAVVRGLHVAPEQMSVWSAAAKYLVPKVVEEVIGDLSVILGARNYLREAHDSGIFQKMLRDSAVVSMGHAGSFINLTTISQNLAKFADHRKRDLHDDEQQASVLAALFDWNRSLPAFEPAKLSLFNNGRDDIVNGVRGSLEKLNELEGEVSQPALEQIIDLTKVLLDEIDRRDATLLGLMNKYGAAASAEPETFSLAERHCYLYAAATCLHTWLYNRSQPSAFFVSGEWLVLCLRRLLYSPQQNEAELTAEYENSVAAELLRLFYEDKLFSIIPIQLASSGTKANGA
jgi:hypothetical protein